MKMKKITFFSICVLLCILVMSLGSCQKDIKADIDQLKTDVAASKTAIAALNQAIAAGKLIKSYTTTANGYQITLSDNSVISVTNGINGAAGATGATGATGFTPVLGVDVDGYWTVKTSATGTATRIKDVNNADIKAKLSDQLTVANGMLAVGGVATTVQIPTVALNTTRVPNTLLITIKDTATGLLVSYNVPLAADFVQGADIIGLVSPVAATRTVLSYGFVPSKTQVDANLALVNPVTATAAGVTTAFTFAGVTYDALLRAEGIIPVVINPAQASLTGYVFEVIKQNGSLYAIQPDPTPVANFTGSFTKGDAPSNGLYSLLLRPTKAQAVAAEAAVLYPAGYTATNSLWGYETNGQSYELAVRATKGGTREILSGYQYAVRVKADINTVYDYKASSKNPIVTPPDPANYPWKVYVPIGTTKDLLDFYEITATGATLKKTDFYKSAVSIVELPGNSDTRTFVTINTDAVNRSTTSVTTPNTSVTVSNLNMKILPFNLFTFDWRGMYYDTKGINVVFYSALNNTLADNPSFTHVLAIDDPLTTTVNERQKTVLLANPTSSTAMFSQLDLLGKTELFRTYATNLEVKLTYLVGTTVTNIPGVSYEFLDANNNVITPDATGTWGPMLNDVNLVEEARKIRFTYTETAALPGSYTAVLKFTDRRVNLIAGVNTGLFTFNMPFVIQNPDLTATFALLTAHKANLFQGDLLTVYGTYPDAVLYQTATAQTSAINAYYDLFNAYTNLYVPTATTQLVPANYWKFTKTAPATSTAVPNPLTNGLAVLPANNDRYLVQPKTMYTDVPYSIKLTFYYFGNTLNLLDLETIRVQAKSEVKEGQVLANTVAKPAGWLLPAALQVTNGDLVTAVPLSYYFKAVDYLGFNLKAFGRDAANAIVAPVDTRINIVNSTAPGIAKVEIKNTSIYAHLVSVTAGHAGAAAGVIATDAIGANPLDFTIQATIAVAVIQSDVVVPLTVEITDIFGKKLVGTINVTVKKP